MEPWREPLGEEELVYRRVPLVYVENGILSHRAFRPTTNDCDGISLVRAAYTSPEAAARGMTMKPCFLAKMRVRDIRRLGLTVVPDPTHDQPGHCLVPELSTSTIEQTRDIQAQLLGTVLEVLGPVTPSLASG